MISSSRYYRFGRLATIALVVSLITFTAISEVVRISPKKASAETPCGPERILFHVFVAEGAALPKVEVRAVTTSGMERLGETDKLGQICLSDSEIFQPQVQCVLFCRPGYFCGAFIPKEEDPGFREQLLALARVELP